MTAKMEKALAALMTYPTRAEAAKAAGINERTLREYFQNAEFRKRYRELCSEIMEDAAHRAKLILDKCLNVFEAALDDNELRMEVRIRAAEKAADISLRLDENIDMRREIAEMREAVFPEGG